MFLTQRNKNFVYAACRVGVGTVFIYGSIFKIREPFAFLTVVYNYELMGPAMGLVVSLVVPWLEFLIGLALIGNVFGAGAVLMANILLSVFLVAQASALHRSLNIPCGCFGELSQQPIEYGTVLRTSGLLAASLTAMAFFTFGSKPIEPADPLTADEKVPQKPLPT
jgi:putative oxidoreductase